MKRLMVFVSVFVLTFGMSLSPQSQVVSSIAYAGGEGGDRGGFNTSGSSSSTKKTAKKVSKFALYAETIEDTYRKHGMGYYYTKKSRMRRLLERLYEEEKAGERHMKRMLQRIQNNGLGLNDSKRLKPGWAFSIKSVSEAYNKYKTGKITKASYEKEANYWFGFVP